MYGLHTRREQADLWDILNNISLNVGQLPWVVLGDFNVVRRPEERLGGEMSWSRASKDLEKCCASDQLEDLRYAGHQLTWSKGEGDNFLARKLDRVLVNHVWLSALDGAEALHGFMCL